MVERYFDNFTWNKGLAEESKKTYFRVICEFLMSLSADANELSLTAEDVWAYIDFLKSKKGIRSQIDGNEDISAKTVNKNLNILRSFYNYLMVCDVVKENIFLRKEFKIKTNKAPHKRETLALPFNEVHALVNAPDSTNAKITVRDRALLALLFATAVRINTLRNVLIKDLSISNFLVPFISFNKIKGGGILKLPIAPWALQAVKELKAQRILEGATEMDPLFCSYSKRGIPTNKRINKRRLQSKFKHYTQQAGLSGNYSPHSARATAITKLLVDGYSHSEVRRVSGHKSDCMIEVYDKRVIAIENNPARDLCYPRDIISTRSS